MATATKSAIRVAYTLHGGPAITKVYPEAASQTFKAGNAVYLDGSGNVAIFNAAADSGSQRFLGFAAQDGQNNSTAAAVNTTVILPWGVVFEGNVTATGSDQVTAKTQVGNAGTSYALYPDTTNLLHMVDISNPGSKIRAVTIIEISPRGTVGDTNGKVMFMIVPAACQITGAA